MELTPFNVNLKRAGRHIVFFFRNTLLIFILSYSCLRQRARRVVRVDVAATAVRAGVPRHRHALRAGRLHGEGTQIHRESARADR